MESSLRWVSTKPGQGLTPTRIQKQSLSLGHALTARFRKKDEHRHLGVRPVRLDPHSTLGDGLPLLVSQVEDAAHDDEGTLEARVALAR